MTEGKKDPDDASKENSNNMYIPINEREENKKTQKTTTNKQNIKRI